jgi:hypothetical protein
MRAAARAITICDYYKFLLYYARSLAKNGGRSMLFSSGDSSRALASILSGEGFYAGTRTIAVVLFGCNTPFPAYLAQLHPAVNSKTFEFLPQDFAIENGTSFRCSRTFLGR